MIEGKWSSRFLDTVGDKSGTINMAIDGSLTPVDFITTAAANETVAIARMVPLVQDSGAFDAAKYGNGLVLTVGLTGRILRVDGTVELLFDQKSIKTNGDWTAYCFDNNYLKYGIGDELSVFRYTFTKDGAPIYLYPKESFIITVNDDLRGLTYHTIRIGCTSIYRV